jgi:hypothetical protein
VWLFSERNEKVSKFLNFGLANSEGSFFFFCVFGFA